LWRFAYLRQWDNPCLARNRAHNARSGFLERIGKLAEKPFRINGAAGQDRTVDLSLTKDLRASAHSGGMRISRLESRISRLMFRYRSGYARTYARTPARALTAALR
jgi:hypothetical protein